MKKKTNPPSPDIYNQTFVLKKPLTNVTCWNYLEGQVTTFNSGETIRVCNVNDATHTTIQCMEPNGRPVHFPDGRPYTGTTHVHPHGGTFVGDNGYRFIVKNTELAEAIGHPIPTTTPDLIGDLIAYESGTANPKQVRQLFKELRRSKIGKKLQGHYSSRT